MRTNTAQRRAGPFRREHLRNVSWDHMRTARLETHPCERVPLGGGGAGHDGRARKDGGARR